MMYFRIPKQEDGKHRLRLRPPVAANRAAPPLQNRCRMNDAIDPPELPTPRLGTQNGIAVVAGWVQRFQLG